jgi:hypothetical protein
VQGLVAIGSLNRTVVLDDNNMEGRLKPADTEQLRAIRLPNLDQQRSMAAIVPQGREVADINGRAAAIECYLDL